MDDRRRKIEATAWAVAAFVVVLLGARMLLGGGGEPAPVSVGGPGALEGRASAGEPGGGGRGGGLGGSGASRGSIVVDVEGEVRRPGLQRVPAGSRTAAAVARAGGLTRRADPAAVNLAAPLQDGQQVIVRRRGTAGVGAPGVPGAAAGDPGAAGVPGAAGGAPAQPISLATATAAQLDTLDGIGPTLAARILAYRDEHGGFRSVEELKQVDGIGEKRFASLKEGLVP